MAEPQVTPPVFPEHRKTGINKAFDELGIQEGTFEERVIAFKKKYMPNEVADSTIDFAKDGTVQNGKFGQALEKASQAKHSEKLKDQASALETLHTEITELQARIKDGFARPKDYEEAEAARKAARAFFAEGDEGSKQFARAYEAKYGADAVKAARETWKDRSMAFAKDMRSEGFDAARAAEVVDSNRDGVISPEEAKKIEKMVSRAVDSLPNPHYDPVAIAQDNKSYDLIKENKKRLEAAIAAFQETGVYGGEQVNAAPHEVSVQAGASKQRSTAPDGPK